MVDQNFPFETATQRASNIRGLADGFYEIERTEVLHVAALLRAYRLQSQQLAQLEDRFDDVLTHYLEISREWREMNERIQMMQLSNDLAIEDYLRLKTDRVV